ncbi:MAG TPA: amino acid adenylation domain-containing protein, partial [Blastocatellia bacterium]|nr:amino acid adenylation domain-containing protein [Blastocatellia bacterium]
AAIHLSGYLKVAALERCFNDIIRRHESLRTTFQTTEGRPVQVIADKLRLELTGEDLSELPEAEREAAARERITAEAQTPFDLSQPPLMRTRLLRLGADEHILMLTLHHIISDGWSIGIFLRELTTLYNSYAAGIPVALPELIIQYADFAHWQRQWLQGEVLDTQLAYWRRQLEVVAGVLDLPTDRPRPAAQTYRGAIYPVTLPLELTEALKELSRQQGVTLYMLMLAAFDVLLHRYTHQQDIVVGSPIANRNRAETEGLIGFFVNALALRTDLTGDPGFEALLARVREMTLEAYANQDVPFEKLVEALQPERDLSRHPLFQVIFTLGNASDIPLSLPGLTLKPLPVDNLTAIFDLTFLLDDGPEGLHGIMQYSTDLFDEATIARLQSHFRTLLEGIVADPAMHLSELPLLSAAERLQLIEEWNDTVRDFPSQHGIHHLFEERVGRSPDAVALVCGDGRLTYEELNGKSNQLAWYLRALGVGPESLVGLCTQRTPDMVVGALGILKAGGAYVPIDPSYPQERIAFILEDARAGVLVTQQALIDRLPRHSARVLCLDEDWEAISCGSKDNLSAAAAPDHLAYVIYTSGSTGLPKGVAIEHRSTVGFLHWVKAVFNADEMRGVLASTSLCFDLSIFELFGTLSCGGKIILADHALHLPSLPAANEVTLLNTVPSAMAELMNLGAVPASVRTVNLAGEALHNALAQRVYEQGNIERVYNLYGPSEDTTYSTFALIGKGDDRPVPIGRPVTNSQVYILDAGMQPVPVGVRGEVYMGGRGLARGYEGRADLTAEKFIPDPFSRHSGSRLYRTGDLGRYLPDGNVEYLGRTDHLVKLRGYRIELGEIEFALSTYAGLKDGVVLAREDEPGDKHLVAYLVVSQPARFNLSQLREYLQVKLPDYMVPSAFVVLDQMPLTPNGKLDRHALPPPDWAGLQHGRAAVAPRTPVEEMLTAIWESLLNIDGVGVYENFFELGGHSLLATRVVSRVRAVFGVDLPVRS